MGQQFQERQQLRRANQRDQHPHPQKAQHQFAPQLPFLHPVSARQNQQEQPGHHDRFRPARQHLHRARPPSPRPASSRPPATRVAQPHHPGQPTERRHVARPHQEVQRQAIEGKDHSRQPRCQPVVGPAVGPGSTSPTRPKTGAPPCRYARTRSRSGPAGPASSAAACASRRQAVLRFRQGEPAAGLDCEAACRPQAHPPSPQRSERSPWGDHPIFLQVRLRRFFLAPGQPC